MTDQASQVSGNVSVPRRTAERIYECLKAHKYDESSKLATAMRGLLAAPIEQPREIPVAGREVEVNRYLADEQYPGQYSARCDLVPARDFDRLQAEVGDWCIRYRQLQVKHSVERDDLQSDLTKARELLRDINDAPGGSQFKRDIETFLAHQSAPVAKGEPIKSERPDNCSASAGAASNCNCDWCRG